MCRRSACRNVGCCPTDRRGRPIHQSRRNHEALHHRTGDPRRQRAHQDAAGRDRRKSNAVVESLGVPYRWITSYVAGDKVYCVHEADDEETIREHARRGGFPANSVTVVANEFGPHTAASDGATPMTTGCRGAATNVCEGEEPSQRLARQYRDTLYVVGQRERVEHPHILHLVTVRQIEPDVAGE